MHKYDHCTDHPPYKIVIPTTDKEAQVSCKIYNDGSKKGKNIGAAFVVLNTNILIVIAKKYKLPDCSSMTQRLPQYKKQ